MKKKVALTILVAVLTISTKFSQTAPSLSVIATPNSQAKNGIYFIEITDLLTELKYKQKLIIQK